MAGFKEWDLESGNAANKLRARPDPQIPTTHTPNTDKSVRALHPIASQREHFLALIGEALSVGLGLGSAIGIWACINGPLAAINVHLANWVAGLIIGFFLAPFLEKAARLVCGKTISVLKKPSYTNLTRFLDHVVTILAAQVALGPVKGIQGQFGPLHSSPAFEYLSFAVGFTAYSFVKTVFYTIAVSHDYEREIVICAWKRLPIQLFWEYIDHFRHAYLLVTEDIRDFLTFALYPYLMVLWLGYWDSVDPSGHFAWLAHSINIGFFFSFFSIIKEITYQIATLF